MGKDTASPTTLLRRRIKFFFSIVWRPVTGPCRDEPPMGRWRIWWTYGLGIATAWEVAGIGRTRASIAENERCVREVLAAMEQARKGAPS